MNEQRAKGIGEPLEKQPKRFRPTSAEDVPLLLGGQVGVDPVFPLVGVVQKMVVAKRGSDGDPYGEIDEQGKQPVVQWRLERQVVTELVNGEQEGLVDEPAKGVRHQHDEPPRGRAQLVAAVSWMAIRPKQMNFVRGQGP